MTIINPYKIDKNVLPMFVFSDDLNSIFGLGIRKHQGNIYSHVMMMIDPLSFVTQGLTYKSMPIERYLKPNIRLKFWRYHRMDKVLTNKMTAEIIRDLEAPWYVKLYDPIGIIGQILHLRFINLPFNDYCSEKVGKYARMLNLDVKRFPSPADLNMAFERSIDMKVYGYWIGES